MESNIEDLRQRLKENKQINFYPWVGDNYLEGLSGKRVLVLGESHYCPKQLAPDGICYPCCEKHKMTKELGCFSQTEDGIYEYASNYNDTRERYQQTYLCFERAVYGKRIEEQSEHHNFWHHVAFYNYVQYAQKKSRVPLEPGKAEDSSEAFRNVLDILQPDCIIVWGIRLWKLLGWNRFEILIPAEPVEKYGYTPTYNYNFKGKLIPAMAVYHPSSSIGKDWLYWHEFYKKFIGEIDLNHMTK